MGAAPLTRTPLRDSAPRVAVGEPATAAWLVTLPTAVIVLAAMLALGPALGGLLFPSRAVRFWGDLSPLFVQPEPTEQARFLIALLAPVVLAALTIRLVHRPPRMTARTTARLVVATQLVAVLALAGCLAVQWTYRYPVVYSPSSQIVYFTLATLTAAAALAASIAVLARSPRARARFAAWTAETSGRRAGAALVAVAMVTITLLPAIGTDGSISQTQRDVVYHLQFTFDEALAVLDGRSPLGDFVAQYGSLWPYLVAGGMSLLGSSLGVFTLLMAALTGVAMLALLDVLRRVTRSTTTALLLFLPLLATSAYRLHGSAVDRFSLANYFGTMPLRYAGPFLLAWLTARHLDGSRPHRTWPLFAAAGLVAINNVDFGIPALGATIAALLWAGRRPTASALRRSVLEAGLGIAVALTAVAALLLIRTGALPDLSLLFRYPRIYAVGGFSMMPLRPVVGLSTIVFLTYVAAIAVATVHTLRGEPDRLLTGLLAWSGTFGLGTGSYYVGRSIPELLTNLFPSWALAVTLLTVVVVRQIAARASGRPGPLELACLLAFGVLVCSLAQTPAPWAQIERLEREGPRVLAQLACQPFVAAHTEPGERVVVLMPLGHRMSVNLGIDDVAPYTGSQSMQTEEQLDETVGALTDAGGRKLFLSAQESGQAMLAALARHRFALAAQDRRGDLQMWVLRR